MKPNYAMKSLVTLTLGAALAGTGFSCTENAPPNSSGSGHSLGSQQSEGASVMQPYARPPGAANNATPAVTSAAPGELASLSNENTPPPVAGPQLNTDALRTLGQPAHQAQTPSRPQSAAPDDTGPHVPSGPDIPKNAEWTIYCTSIAGPDSLHQATMLKNRLSAATKMKDFYLVSQDTETTLYYGFYQTIDAKESDGQRSKTDREKLASITDGSGQRPLAACWMMQLSTADPAAPAEWNLVNRNKNLRPGEIPYYWTIEVASFRGAKERKEYAVELVMQFRERGIEAYFYHGRTTSSVCIGAWPETAVRHDETPWDNIDPNSPVMIIDPRLPNTNQEAVTPDGERVQTIHNRYVIVDDSMNKVMKDYPYHALNGEGHAIEQTDPQTHKTDQIQDRSFLTVIPGAAKAAVGVGNALVPYSRIEWHSTGDNGQAPPGGMPTGMPGGGAIGNTSSDNQGVVLPPIPTLPPQPDSGGGNH